LQKAGGRDRRAGLVRWTKGAHEAVPVRGRQQRKLHPENRAKNPVVRRPVPPPRPALGFFARRNFPSLAAFMKLLLTNDDGVDSPFLHELAHALRSAGHSLCVAAPRVEQSWIGAAKSRRRAVAAASVDRGLGCPVWSVDGTPADCVNIALAHLLPDEHPFDAVISGINIGRNAGLGFIIASGTLGGAWEGALHGLPAVAFSQELSQPVFVKFHADPAHPDPDRIASLRRAAARAAALLPGLLAATPPRSFIVQNVNFPHPCPPDVPLKRTIPSRTLVPNLFAPDASGSTYNFRYSEAGDDLSPPGALTDTAALAAGFASHTTLDYTKLGA
jgi:5'-nucleotidase